MWLGVVVWKFNGRRNKIIIIVIIIVIQSSRNGSVPVIREGKIGSGRG